MQVKLECLSKIALLDRIGVVLPDSGKGKTRRFFLKPKGAVWNEKEKAIS
jgi:hypothetical protein